LQTQEPASFPTRRASDLWQHAQGLKCRRHPALLEGTWPSPGPSSAAPDKEGPPEGDLRSRAQELVGAAVMGRPSSPPDCLRPPRSEEHTSELQSRFDIVC